MSLRPEFLYLMALKITQPAREQEIHLMMNDLAKNLEMEPFDKSLVKQIHHEMRKQRIIFPVKRGIYWLTKNGEAALQDRKLVRVLESNRLFLMKLKRRRIR